MIITHKIANLTEQMAVTLLSVSVRFLTVNSTTKQVYHLGKLLSSPVPLKMKNYPLFRIDLHPFLEPSAG